MTVCVATMANNGAIFGAADRMLTRGITQTEPGSAKIYNFEGPPPVTVMWAGNSGVFGEVVQMCLHAAKAAPHKFKSVQDYMDLYCDSFAALVGKRAERAILTRLGLTRQTLVSNKVTDDRAASLVEQVTSYCLRTDESVEVIIAGHDDDGPHIWSVLDDMPCCHDVEGFAAIGTGADHADSHLRFAGFTRQAESQEALIMAYLAKRRAEVAPGVGKATDLLVRGTDRKWLALPDDWIRAFDVEYEKFVESEKQALASAVKSVTAVMQEKTNALTQKIESAGPQPVELGQQPQEASTDRQ